MTTQKKLRIISKARRKTTRTKDLRQWQRRVRITQRRERSIDRWAGNTW